MFYSLFHNHSVCQRSPPLHTFPLRVNTQDESVFFLLVVLQSLCILTHSTFILLTFLVVQKRKLKALTWPPIHLAVTFNKCLKMNNLFVCIITPEKNNKQYLVSYFYKHVAFLRVFYKKTCMLRHSSYIFWLSRKYCEWIYAAATLEPIH